MKLRIILATAFVVSMLASFGCGGAATNNATTNTAANTTTTTNSTTTNTATTSNSASANADTAKTDTTAGSGPATGVAECDEYITKYEACLTKIAAQAPQSAPALKTAFEAQRNGFKTAAANPQTKATLGATCKQAIETAKTATKAYACDW